MIFSRFKKGVNVDALRSDAFTRFMFFSLLFTIMFYCLSSMERPETDIANQVSSMVGVWGILLILGLFGVSVVTLLMNQDHPFPLRLLGDSLVKRLTAYAVVMFLLGRFGDEVVVWASLNSNEAIGLLVGLVMLVMIIRTGSGSAMGYVRSGTIHVLNTPTSTALLKPNPESRSQGPEAPTGGVRGPGVSLSHSQYD